MAAEMRRAGYRPGMTVAVLIAHPPEGVLLQLALHLVGVRAAWVAGGMPKREVEEFLERIQPDLFIYDTRTHVETSTELAERLGLPVLCLGPGGLGRDLLQPRASDTEPFDVDTAVGAPETIFLTSGTTGVPKLIHHGAKLYEQMFTLARAWVAAGQPLLRHMTLTPMWYVAGQTSAVLNLFSGGVLYVMFEFEAPDYLAAIEKHRANSVYISPLMLNSLLDCPAVATTDTSSLVLLSVGGSATPPARLREAIDRFGPVVRITYGLSETPFISAFPNIDDDPARPNRITSCGPTYGDVRIEIRDEHGTVLPTGEVGEIWVASKLNFLGYWGDPAATAETLVDGWLRTHDLAYADDEGYLHLVARDKDLIITGIGCYHIFPRPIENVLATHPQVRAAAVIGVPHPKFGEAAHAYVVTTPDAAVTEEELSELVAEQLTRAWMPRSIEFVTDLPRTGSGKANLKALRQKWAEEHEPAPIGAAG
jgi:acyl-coenzyme A synthetase/AMP-(fatty) acid ligase